MTNVVSVEINEKIATITLQNGKVNAFSHELIDQLNAALDQAEEAGAVVILTGQPGIFSGGFDLKTMQKGMAEATELVTKGSKLTRRMLAFPTPIIGACSGHAIAKGCFVMLCCDYRIGVEGEFNLGLNEVAIGMTMHHAGIEMARARMPQPYFDRSVMLAEIFNPNTAIDAGILDKVVAPEALLPTAQAVAKHFLSLNLKAHHATKVKVREALYARLDKAIELDHERLF